VSTTSPTRWYPSHGKRKTRNAALFGAAGALYTRSGSTDGHAIGGQPLPHEIAIGLTPTRAFVFALGSMTGKAQLPPLRVVTRDHIVGIASTSTRTLHIKQTLIWVRMADGSELRLETAQRHWRHGDELVEELLGSGVAAMETPPAFRPSQKPK
jgi:hypothetical protein